MPRPPTFFAASGFLQTLATVVLVVFVLDAGRPVIVPVAFAILGAFVLAPIVALLERVGLGRVPAALLTFVLAAAAVTGVGWLVVSQVTDLARDLPTHREQLKIKIDQLRGAGGPIPTVIDLLRDVTDGGGVPSGAGHKPGSVQPAGQPATDQTVVARIESSSPLARMTESAVAALGPLAAVALVTVLVIFMLIGREDLRDRVLGVVGKGRLIGATRVLTESAHKVSRFLLFLLAVNAGFGLLLTAGLLVIGVPYAPLWGFLSGLLRFVPYVGTWASALFPLALSFATSTGWAQPIAVFAYFLVLDLVTANVVEPLLFGHHTGVAPLALLVAAAFWTWVWGPLGLVLSTPITVCLAVMGQHVPRLRPVALLLSDRPALPTAVRYYQRLVAGDRDGAAGVAEEVATRDGLDVAYDTVVIPALGMATRDRAAGRLTAEEEQAVFEGTAAVLRSPVMAPDVRPEPGPAAGRGLDRGPRGAARPRAAPCGCSSYCLRPDGYRVAEVTTQLLPAQIEQMVADLGQVFVVS